MEIDELIKKVESIIIEEKQKFENKQNISNAAGDKDSKSEVIYLILPYFLRFFKVLFYYIPKGFKIAKNDFLIYGMIMGTFGVLFIFFIVLWFSVSAAFGIYFYENGSSMLVSILFSIGFQILSFILVSIFIYLSTRKLKSVKIMDSITSYLK